MFIGWVWTVGINVAILESWYLKSVWLCPWEVWKNSILSEKVILREIQCFKKFEGNLYKKILKKFMTDVGHGFICYLVSIIFCMV